MLYNKCSWIGKYFGLVFENPLKTWWKARKYFKFPKVRFSFGGLWLYPTLNDLCAKILDIWITDVSWKDKYNSPRHIRNPYICITLFRKYCFLIEFGMTYITVDGKEHDCEMEYWEYMLDYVYYSKKLSKPDLWQTQSIIFTDTKDKPITIYIPTVAFSLNKQGRKEFRRLYAKLRS